MKRTQSIAISTLTAMLVFGLACGESGDGPNPSGACNDLCDAADDCFDDFDRGGCREICDEVDDLEGEVSDSCEEGVEDFFSCVADLSCTVLEDVDIDDVDDFESAFDALSAVLVQCRDEAEDAVDACEDE